MPVHKAYDGSGIRVLTAFDKKRGRHQHDSIINPTLRDIAPNGKLTEASLGKWLQREEAALDKHSQTVLQQLHKTFDKFHHQLTKPPAKTAPVASKKTTTDEAVKAKTNLPPAKRKLPVKK